MKDSTSRQADQAYRKHLIMVTKQPQHLSLVSSSKTCAHCGQDFGASGRAYPLSKQASLGVAKAAPKLSFRERQIVELIQQAKTNKQIAYELCLTVGTVKEYVYHIFRKLGVTNRTELALRDKHL
jgi:DNA-binding NarL/FixJ family response regulator